MEEFFNVEVKNHKKLNKKIIYIEYIKEDFFPSLETVKKNDKILYRYTP